MATPSTLGSQREVERGRGRASGSWRRRRSAQARSSASSKALSRLIMGTRWRTSAKSAGGGGAAHRLGGRVGRDQLGVVGLELRAARAPARRSRRRGSRGRRGRGSARCGTRSGARSSAARAALAGRVACAVVTGPVATASRRRSPAPSTASGSAGVVEGHGLARRHRALAARRSAHGGARARLEGAGGRPAVGAHLGHGRGPGRRAAGPPR